MTGQGVALLEVSCGCRTGLGFASPNWVCRAGKETKIPWGCPENTWGMHRCICGICKIKLAKQLLLIYLIYRRPEGNSIPIYELVGQKSPGSDSEKSQGLVGQCCPVQVAKCSQDKLAKPHLSTVRGCKDRIVQPNWEKLKSNPLIPIFFFLVKSCAVVGAKSGFCCFVVHLNFACVLTDVTRREILPQ